MQTGLVSVWIPLLVALIGFLGIIGSQVISARREDRRLARESRERESQRISERETQKEERNLARKVEAYEKAMNVNESWGWSLFPIARPILSGEKTGLTVDERELLTGLRESALEALAPLNMFAPEAVREPLRLALVSRADFTRHLLLDDETLEDLNERWKTLWDLHRKARDAVRKDLEIG